jgi:hypothetical protein
MPPATPVFIAIKIIYLFLFYSVIYLRYEGNGRQPQLSSFSVLCGFNAACFGPYTRSHYHVNKTQKENYYVNRIMLFILCMSHVKQKAIPLQALRVP